LLLSRAFSNDMNSTKLKLEEVVEPVSIQIQPKDFGDVPYVGLEDISSYDFVLKRAGKSNQAKSTKWKFQSDDILYGKLRPYLNKCVLADRAGICSTDILVLRAKKQVIPKYIVYAMSNNDFVEFANSTVSGMNLPRTTWSKIKHYEIPVPNIAAQRRIVEGLDNLEKLDEKGSKDEDLAQKLCQSITQQELESIEANAVSLGGVCEITKGTFPTLKTPGGIYSFVVTSEKRRTANAYQFDDEAVCIPLVSSTGHGHASLHRIHYENGKFALANIMAAVISQDKEKVLPKYLYYYLSFYKNELLVTLMRGVANVTIPISKLSDIPIKIPDIATQRRIVAVLDKAEELKSKVLHRKQLAKQLKASSLYYAFVGQGVEEKVESPVISPIQPTTAPRMFDVQQAVAQILRRFERGEMVVAKVLYIGQVIFDVPTNIQFSAQNFGPYDTAVKKAVTAGLSPRNRFFSKKGSGTNQVLTLGANADKILKYSTSNLASKTNDYLDQMLSLFSQSDSAGIERLATLCKIIEDERTTDERVIRAKLQVWKPNKFDDEDVSKTLAFIKTQGWDKKLLKQI